MSKRHYKVPSSSSKSKDKGTNDKKSPVIGIDLGTTSSCVAVFANGRVEIIPNDHGERTTPSYVAFTKYGRLIGEDAKDQACSNHTNTIYGVQRLIGRKFNDHAVHSDMKHLPFKLISASGERPMMLVEHKGVTKALTAEQITAMIITKMKDTAEDFLETTVQDAVITVPAYFNDSQRKAMMDAAAMAGLNVIRTINSSTAASLAYGLEHKGQGERNVLVFDMGGGALDLSILFIDDNIFNVKCTVGDGRLGGDDFDFRMINHFVGEFQQKHNIDIAVNSHALCRLRVACEAAKITLSSAHRASVDLDSLVDGIDFHSSITRDQFEELCDDLFRKTLDLVKRALRDAEMNKSSVHDIVLVGGSTRIPKVQKLLSDFFSGKELNKRINPDEAVAYGAAIQAAILSEDQFQTLQDVLLFDVNLLSLGVETIGGVMNPIIKKNTTIPFSASHTFTCANRLSTVNVKVFEGECAMTKDNYLLGKFKFDRKRGKRTHSTATGTSDEGDCGCLEKRPKQEDKSANDERGEDSNPQIKVTFDIDASSCLQVTVQETSNQKTFTITNDKNRLSKGELERMINEEKMYKDDDEAQRKLVADINSFVEHVSIIKQTRSLKKFKETITDHGKKKIDDKCDEITTWLDSNQTPPERNEFEKKRRDFNTVCNPIMSKFYKMSGRVKMEVIELE